MQELYKDVTISMIVSWWGAFVATGLAIIKLMETLRDRTRIDVGTSFTTSEHVGHEIRIRNISPRPVVLTHWEIYYASRYWHRSGKKDIETREFDSPDSTIPPFSTYTLGFSGQSYFPINYKNMKSRAIYIEIHFAGRRRIRRKIYS